MSYRDKVLMTLLCLSMFTIWVFAQHDNMNRAKAIVVEPLYPSVREVGVIVDITSKQKREQCKQVRACTLLAEAIVWEARGETINGQYDVASVILNRVDRPMWKNTVEGVIHSPGQFEYLDNMHLQKQPTQANWDSAYVIAYNLKYNVLERTTTADHYLNPKVVRRMPNWTRVYARVKIEKNHHFYDSLASNQQ